jgi:hypothetical protein
LKDWNAEDWLQPSREKITQLLDFVYQHFSFTPSVLPDTASSSLANASDNVASSDVVPSNVSSSGKSSDQGEQRRRVLAFLQDVFPAVKGAGAEMTEDQKLASQKRTQIMKLLGLIVVGNRKKGKKSD